MKNINCSKIYPWVVVALLWVVALLNYMDRQMLSTMRDSMQMDIRELESAVNFGRLMAIFLWIYGMFSPFAGAIADRISRKWLIIASLGVWSTVTLLMGWCTSFTEIYWLRALMGISEALYIPASLSLIADYHQGKSRSLAIGIHMTGLYMGQAIGGFGATVAAAFSWQTTFHWFGIIGVLYAVVLILFLREKRDNSTVSSHAEQKVASGQSVWRTFSLLFSNIAFWVILFYFASPSLPGWATKNWLPTLFAETLGIPMSQAGPISTITIAVSSFIGVMVGGPLSDWWVKRNLRGRIYTGAIGLSLMIPALLLLGMGHGMIAVVACRLVLRHRLWNVRCKQYAHPLSVYPDAPAGHGLWHHEYDGRLCGGYDYEGTWKLVRQWQSRSWLCLSGGSRRPCFGAAADNIETGDGQ
jgi:MFS family permease